ncbi:hypothetical protein M431DRAFT_131280, partial [Trichoderma harzianum CBS 226.95]
DSPIPNQTVSHLVRNKSKVPCSLPSSPFTIPITHARNTHTRTIHTGLVTSRRKRRACFFFCFFLFLFPDSSRPGPPSAIRLLLRFHSA